MYSITPEWIRRDIEKKLDILFDEVLSSKMADFIYLISFKPWILHKDGRLEFVLRYLIGVHAKFPSAGNIPIAI